ncbi:MAG: hypothetical protein PHV20_03105 [Bacteroidales bacterium]|nr:hypothetical protein [Bacteroidales bacterium]
MKLLQKLFVHITINKWIPLLTFVSIILCNTSVYAQKIDIIFSKGLGKAKTIQIELSDSTGLNNPSASNFNQSNRLFFFIKPSEGQKWYFSAKDIENKLKELKLIQGEKIVVTSSATPTMIGEDIAGAIVSFSKSEINLTKAFKIRIKELDSEDLIIPQTLWPNYNIFTQLIKKSQGESSQKNYSQSFASLSKLWSKENQNVYLREFAFYKSATDSINQLSLQAGNAFIRVLSNEIEALKKESSEAQIASIHTLGAQYLSDLHQMDSFYVARNTEFDAKTNNSMLSSFSTKIQAKLKEADEFYVKQNLSIFETGNYQDYRFRIYVELISKLITSVEKISIISSFDSIPISQIKSYKSIYKEISDMNWDRNFKVICQLLNNNIKKDKALFNEAVLTNLENNKATEPQPYALLFKGFNSLIKNDKPSFTEYISQSKATITDKELLLNLDLFTSLMTSNVTKNDEFWSFIQKGFEAQNNGTLQEAKTYYEKAEKLSNTNEVLYLLMAQTNLKLNDRYSAEIYFKRANTINPKFILPKLYQIDFLTDDKDFETALTYTNEALTTSPYWYFYYMKALLLQLTGKNEDAKVILTNNCITLNPMNYEEYLLLGDVYSNLNDLKNARENYMKAGNIKPNDIVYKKKMEALKFFQVKATK